jgi:hypothetical protein
MQAIPVLTQSEKSPRPHAGGSFLHLDAAIYDFLKTSGKRSPQVEEPTLVVNYTNKEYHWTDPGNNLFPYGNDTSLISRR